MTKTSVIGVFKPLFVAPNLTIRKIEFSYKYLSLQHEKILNHPT